VPLVDGVYNVALKDLSPRQLGHVRFTIRGKHQNYAVGAIPVTGTIVIDSPIASSGQCGEAKFPGPSPAPACRFNSVHSTLRCR
jgi:hypothetical protein